MSQSPLVAVSEGRVTEPEGMRTAAVKGARRGEPGRGCGGANADVGARTRPACAAERAHRGRTAGDAPGGRGGCDQLDAVHGYRGHRRQGAEGAGTAHHRRRRLARDARGPDGHHLSARRAGGTPCRRRGLGLAAVPDRPRGGRGHHQLFPRLRAARRAGRLASPLRAERPAARPGRRTRRNAVHGRSARRTYPGAVGQRDPRSLRRAGRDRDPQCPAARGVVAGDGLAGAREGRAARRVHRAVRARDASAHRDPPRSADRPGEPRAAAGAAGGVARRAAAGRGRVLRSRPLQAHQRLVRPRGRRRGAAGDGPLGLAGTWRTWRAWPGSVGTNSSSWPRGSRSPRRRSCCGASTRPSPPNRSRPWACG